MSQHLLFTSESVAEGHPDKMCDIISDTILDACLAQDPDSKVACETCTKTGMIVLLGEITSNAIIDYQKLVRDAIKKIGYDSSQKFFDADTCSVMVAVSHQSSDIAEAVWEGKSEEDLGAGDQGIMFGYATNETPELFPLTHLLASRLAKKLADVRKSGVLPYLGPDAKTQVTIEYEKTTNSLTPRRIHTVLISAMHTEDVTIDQLRRDIKEKVIDEVIPHNLVDPQTIIHINPGGRFVIGGPAGDAGLTGRKVIVDSYGGWGAHGGGAFSGKDPSKVDRSACYAARWVAKSLVAAGLCDRCLVQLSYAIGVSHPLSVFVDTYGTGKGKTDEELVDIVNRNFDLRPFAIIRDLDLKRPIYAQTAAYGHFGRDDLDLPWEKPKTLQI